MMGFVFRLFLYVVFFFIDKIGLGSVEIIKIVLNWYFVVIFFVGKLVIDFGFVE